jgi:lipoprotein NlpI
VLAHVSRAAALQLGGDYQEAIADYDSAIRLQPVPSLYRYRGIAYLAWGRLEDAADDFVQMLGLDPVNAEAAIWLHIARQKAGGGDGPELAGNVQKVDLARWPGPVLSYMAGRGSLEDATRAAQTDDLAIRAQRRCQLAFFLGEERLNDGDPEALRLLREARDICPPESAERALARMDLLRGGR